ncbi:MAG TPA: hypothetical protein VJV78_49820 [Polyangiales bacterium]|nr:hypothetical protein [Polyangiales bacterium]
MLVFPALNLGIFVASNSSGGGRLIPIFHELLLRHYFPALPQSAPKPVPGDAREYAGDYRRLRRNYAELEVIFSLDSVFAIDAQNDGSLIIRERPEEPVRYVRIAHDLFQNADGDERVAFLRDSSGRVARVVASCSPINASRVRFFETALWLRAWSVAGLVAAVALLLRRRRGDAAKAPGVERWLRLTACLWLAFYVAAATWQLRYGFGYALQGYPQPILKLGLWLLMAAVGATAIATLLLPLLWRAPGWSIARRAASSLALAVLLMTTFVLAQWNAVGLHYF